MGIKNKNGKRRRGIEENNLYLKRDKKQEW